MTNKEKETKAKSYGELTCAERFERIEKLYEEVRMAVLGDVPASSEETFFITLHNLGRECDKFIQHYFNGTTPEEVIGNVDLLNQVNRINLMIKVR